MLYIDDVYGYMTKLYGSENSHYFPFVMIIGPDIATMACTVSCNVIINAACLVYTYVGRKCYIGGSVNLAVFLIHLFFYCMAAFSDCGAIPKNLSLLESKEKYSEFGRVLKCRIY